MRFDQVRREFKKTLWGEELDNEGYNSPAASALDLGFLHQYEGKKYRCIYCLKEYHENDTILTHHGSSCTKCFQTLFISEGS